MRYSLLLCILLSFSGTVFSQHEKQYAFTHFRTNNGLASNSVFNILQDKQGYIWFSTVDGLQRYDGNRFLTFRHSSTDPHSIPSDFVVQLTMDKDGNIWIYAGNKIGFFNTVSFSFTPVPIEGEDSSKPYDVRFFDNAANGYIALYAHGKGIFIYDPVSKMFKPEISFKLSEKQGLSAVESIDSGSSYWIASFGGLMLYNSKTKNLNYRGHNPDNNIFIDHLKNDTTITNFFGYQSDTLWYSSWPMVAYAPFLHILDLKTNEKKTYSISKLFGFGYIEIGGALFQPNGRKWFYGRSFIAEYTGNEKKPFQLMPNAYTGEQSINFDRVYQMTEDRQHNIWIATDNGAFVFNPDMQVFNSYKLRRSTDKEEYDAPTTEACELKNGNVFIGTWGKGLFYYDNKFNVLPLPQGLQELARTYMIWCIHEHSKTGLIWLGMQSGGMCVYDTVKKKLDIINLDVFKRSTLRQVTEDRFGNLWFGLQNGGVIKWNMQAAEGDFHKGYEMIKAKGTYYIQKMYTGNDGNIWVGTLNDGLYKYDALTGHMLAHYTKNNLNNEGLWSNGVNDLYSYNDSLMLIADEALDILNIKTNKITHVSTETGLPSNTVLSIEADDKGILWLGMVNQLCRFDLAKKIFSTFDRRDGISYDVFSVAGDYKMKDGRIVYLTDKNFTVFNPQSVATTPSPGKVVITGFKLGNQSLAIDSLSRFNTIDLKYNNTSVSIEFSALNYTPQNKLNYYYMLEGIDKTYQPAAAINEAIYNYLPAGNYTFKVKTENTEGQESAVTELHIRVVPPFWFTWWFGGLIILIVLAVFYWIDKERIKKLQALQKVRTQIAQNLHSDVNTTLNHISLLSEMAKIKADKDIDRSKEYIEQINDKSRSMIDGMNDMMWTLDPQNDSMEKTILRMKEYAEGLQNTYPVQIQMEVEEAVKSLKTDMKLRHEIFLIFKSTLHFIAEDAGNALTVINVDYFNKKILLKIRNNGADFSGPGAAQTIKQIINRASIVNADIDIQTDKGISLIMLASLNQI